MNQRLRRSPPDVVYTPIDVTSGGVFHVQVAFPVKSASDPVVVGARSDEISSGAELLERWEYGDPVEPARYYVHLEVNVRLTGHVSPAVLPYRKGLS